MILIKNISLKNFISHADTKIDFQENQKVLIDGASGAGKSSIVEGLLWALYGQGRSNNRSLIRLGAKEATVSVIIQDNEIAYKIERTIDRKGKHSLILYKLSGNKLANCDLISDKIKETQEMIENDILHASYFLFINSIAYPQDNPDSFVKQTASKRKDLILEIIKASNYDKYYAKTKNVLLEIEQNQKTDKFIISNNEQKIKLEEKTIKLLPIYQQKDKNLKIKIKEIKNQISEAETLFANEQVTRAQIVEKRANIQNFNAHISLVAAKLQSLTNKKNEINAIDSKQIELGVKTLEQKRIELKQLKEKQTAWMQWNKERIKIERIRPLFQDFNGIILRLNNQIMETIKAVDTYCPELGKTCVKLEQQVKDKNQFFIERLKEQYKQKQEYDDAIALYNQKLEALGQPPETVDNKIEITENEVLKLQDYEKQSYVLANLGIRKAEIEKEINELRTELNTYALKLKKIETEILSMETNLNEEDLNQKRQELNNQYGVINMEYTINLQSLTIAAQKAEMVQKVQEEIKILEEKLKQKDEEADALKLLAEAFGSNGIKAVLIDYVIPRLEDKINDILGKLSNFRVKLETQKSGLGKNTVLEGLFITIINDIGEELDFQSYSGGERMRIIIAISEGLADLSKQVGFRILDEAIVGLDQETAEGFSKVILDVQNRFNQLICISHLPNIKDMFNDKIEVVKINGVSQII